MTVLIVEDSDACAATIEVALEGFDTKRVRATEAALKLLDREWPVAVVTDLNLPGASGYDLIRRLRESSGSRPRLPVIVISAETDPDAGERALAAGADAYFPKPFSPAVLRTRIEELIHAANHSDSDAAPDSRSAPGRDT